MEIIIKVKIIWKEGERSQAWEGKIEQNVGGKIIVNEEPVWTKRCVNNIMNDDI